MSAITARIAILLIERLDLLDKLNLLEEVRNNHSLRGLL
jgi:hypothetical protein